MNGHQTVSKVEPARHWVNGEWIGSPLSLTSRQFTFFLPVDVE
jgi:hypothetical protein